MIEIMYDIASGSTYKFNTAWDGIQVEPLAGCSLNPDNN